MLFLDKFGPFIILPFLIITYILGYRGEVFINILLITGIFCAICILTVKYIEKRKEKLQEALKKKEQSDLSLVKEKLQITGRKGPLYLYVKSLPFLKESNRPLYNFIIWSMEKKLILSDIEETLLIYHKSHYPKPSKSFTHQLKYLSYEKFNI